MSANTKIEWTDATWNPVIGCSRVSEGCRNCYAETIAGRFGNGKPTVYSGLTQIVNGRAVWTGQIKETKQLLQPLSWKKPKRIFVNSMSDLFHENVTDEMRDRIFAVMALCPQHTFQVLTKRPERMLAYLANPRKQSTLAYILDQVNVVLHDRRDRDIRAVSWNHPAWPLPNVWLGVSVENQAAADERIPLLLQTPAASRFISAEPLLGAVDLTCCQHRREFEINALTGDHGVYRPLQGRSDRKLDWVICGGESGPNARPMHPEWARSLRDQCQAAGVPFFFKQWGEYHTRASLATSGEPVFRQFTDFQHWVNKARTWVNGGICVDADGKICHKGSDFKSATYPVTVMHRVGKHSAGALLDGAEWKQFPEVQR